MRNHAPTRFAALLAALPVLAVATSAPARALSMADPLSAWTQASAMDRMQLATRLGKSFVSLNDGFTTGYFLKCIDDVSTYGGARQARIEDAMRECVKARMPRSPDDE